MSYHDAITRIAAQDWDKVSLSLQMRDIPDADIPRLLYECILDMQEWRGKAHGLIREIDALQARTKQYRGDSVDPPGQQ